MPKKTRRRRPVDTQPLPTRATCRCREHTKPIELFAKARGKHVTICKTCDAARARARYWTNAEKARAQSRANRQRNAERVRAQRRAGYWRNVETERARARERAHTERGRASNRRAVAKYRRAHPEIVAAHKIVRRAVSRGEVRVAMMCEVKGCRETKDLHLHHLDYRKPLEVIRICRRSHEDLHHRGVVLPLKPGAPWKVARAPRQDRRARTQQATTRRQSA